MTRALARRRAFCLTLCLMPGLRQASAAAPPLVVVIDSATELPMADIVDGQLRGGLLPELAQLLGRQLGREIRFQLLPRKRVLEALLYGQVDFLCNYAPAWLPGPLQWSRPLLGHEDVLISRAKLPAPTSLGDLRGRTVGTVLGFVYPELERRLGSGFVRADAPSADANLRKLQQGRIDHAVVERRLLAHYQRSGRLSIAVHPPLPVSRVETQCALGSRARLSMPELDAAISAIQQDGSLQQLLARYELPSTRSSSRP